MRLARSLRQLPARLPSPAVTIGNFDGVHHGHQRILRAAVRRARARGGLAVAVTFHPHPAKVLAPKSAPPLLTTPAQRLALLEAAGIDLTLELPFTRQLARLSPRQFAERVLCRALGARSVAVGANFRFGHRHAGDVAALRQRGREFGFTVQVVPPVTVGGAKVSSSAIRRLLAAGEVERATRLLGRPFAVTGPIERGAGRGTPMGFPTLNLVPEQECLPARGVYITQTLLRGKLYSSATNVGIRPTFDGRRLTVESHLLGFSRRVRGGRLEVRFLRRLRDERKFSSLTALRRQIQKDVAATRRYFARR